MVPMIDPMVPEPTTLLTITPSLAGVLVAILAALAAVAVGTWRELGRTRPARPPLAAPAQRTRRAPLPV